MESILLYVLGIIISGVMFVGGIAILLLMHGRHTVFTKVGGGLIGGIGALIFLLTLMPIL